MALKTNYKDDVLDLTQNANRKYEEIENQDGSISFNDVTVYEETGDTFGAADANAITRALTDTTRNISFQFGIDTNGDYGYIKDGETEVTPFKSRHTETYKPTVRANNNDMGLYHNKRYVDTTAVPNSNTGTYTASSRGAALDMGATNTYRYVNTNSVPNSNSGTYPNNTGITANGTYDMGATNTYRYVKVNVANKAVLVASYATDPYAGAYGQGVLSCNLTGYAAVLLKISGRYNQGDNQSYVYIAKGQSAIVGDWSGTSGGGRSYEFLSDGSGIKEGVQGNSYGAWGAQWCSEIWGLTNTLF